MDGLNEMLIAQIAQVQEGLDALSLDDPSAIIPLGAALELISEDVPDQPAGLDGLLALTLQALQALFQDEVPDPTLALEAAREAISAARDVLSHPGSEDSPASLASAAECLRNALAAAPEPPTLDDLAIRLMQTDPADPARMDQLKDGMRRLADSGALPADATACLNDAVTTMSDSDVEPAEALACASRMIEAAMEAADDECLPEPEPATPDPIGAMEAPEPTPDFVPTPEPLPEAGVVPELGAADVMLLPSDADTALLGEFATECRELLDAAEASLLALEMDPEDTESVNTVFRAFHTIKGTSGFLGITSMVALAHQAETLLSRMRDGEIRCIGGYADLALRSLDTLKELVRAVQDSLGGAPADLPDSMEDLLRDLADPDAAIALEAANAPTVVLARVGAVPAPLPQPTDTEPDPRLPADRVERPRAAERQETTVRVRMDRLDSLIEMVGELVIAQSMVAQDPTVETGGLYELTRKVGHAGKIIRELQALSLSMRMVPLKPTFQKMTRLVRDLAHKSGKSVAFSTDGEDTEIDRNMVDLINDPLVHLIRNAMDHGIEPPEARVAAGKPREGSVRLSAYHSSGSVVVEVRDDGRGLDAPKIIARAIERGIVEAGRSMTDREAYDLIFAPGFSTAEQVTEISGRGVGMDVVRRSVESLQGRIDITSEPGKGCIIALRVPLTLAITDGMLVRVGNERYIIPTASIHLCFRPEPSSLSTVTGRGEMVLLRDSLMPIFRVHRLFNVQGAKEDPTEGLLVVVGNDGRLCSVLVDELLGQQQVVAKSLGSEIYRTPGISGAAILGDGRVGLILDTVALVSLAQQAVPSTSRSGLVAA